MTNPDFDWDEVIVSKKPKQKEIETAFLSDPDIELGSIEQEDPVERPISSQGLTECGTQKCSAGDDYLAALPYDEGIRSYGETGVFTTVDTPAAIRFRITDNPTWPNSPNVLDNYYNWNISGRYDLTRSSPTYKAPCENRLQGITSLDSTFLNGSSSSAVAFYPRSFEVAGGLELEAGDNLTVRSVAGQYLYGRDPYGGVKGNPSGDAVWNFISLRLRAFGKDTITNNFTGLNCEEVYVIQNADLRVYQGTTSNAQSRLTTDKWNIGNNDNLAVHETFLEPDGPYLQSGDITGSYMFKAEMVIDMIDSETAVGHTYVECEHVRSGKKSFCKQGFLATGLNGGLKLTDPWTLTQGNAGGMPDTTRYWGGNYDVARTLYFIAYDGWEKESVVRKACMEFERSQPHWEPADYCSRIL